MQLISIRNLRADAAKYPDVTEQVEAWYRVVKSASWQHLDDVRQVYPAADTVGNFTFDKNVYGKLLAEYQPQVITLESEYELM